MADDFKELRLEQYKLLRSEVMGLVDEGRKIEVIVIAGIGALYAWLTANGIEFGGIWFVGSAFALFGGFRAWGLFRRIEEIAEYMRLIETPWPELELPDDQKPTDPEVQTRGWELYRKSPGTGKFPLRVISLSLWAAILFVSLIVPWLLK